MKTRLGCFTLLFGLLISCQRVAPNDLPLTVMPGPLMATETPAPASNATSQLLERGSADADVTYVRAVLAADGTWTFHVTVAHPDTGWEDYADGWDVVLPDGEVIQPDADSPFTRLLLHPHQDEQPFTRSQSQIKIPAGITEVRVRAHDLRSGFGGRTVTVDLSVSSGADFVVQR